MIDLEKIPTNTTSGINLKKSTETLGEHLVDLSKKKGIDLEKHIAKVAVVLDYSGSMSGLYNSGKVQKVLNRLFPLALRFDDNGELDVFLFSNGYKQMEGMTLENYEDYVKKVILKSSFSMGGTEYAPVINGLLKEYSSQKKQSFLSSIFKNNVQGETIDNTPTFVIFITDGENYDERETDQAVRESSKQNIFIQFVGIGNERFSYLSKLDDLDGRPVDNTGFIRVKDFEKISDEEVYQQLLDQYPDWLKAKGLK